MKNFFRIILSVVSTIILAALILPLVLSILLSNVSIQNWAVDKFSEMASRKIGTRVEVDHIAIKFFNRVVIEGLYLEDYAQDTLAYVGRLDVGVRGYDFANKKLMLGGVKLDRTDFFLQQDSSGQLNLTQILARLKSGKASKPSSAPFKLSASSLNITKLHFKYRRYEIPPKEYGVNFSDMDVRDFHFHGQNIELVDDSVSVTIDSLRFYEKCGFRLDRFSSSKTIVSSRGIKNEQLHMISRYSELNMHHLYLLYDNWRAYSDFTNKVSFDAEIYNSSVSFQTVAYFAPSLRKWKGEYNISGEVSGPINNMRGNMSRIAFGNTRMDLLFAIKGIPDIDNTKFSFEIGELITNYDDAELVYSDFTGKSLHAMADMMRELGTIRFSGDFDGLLKNFKADGVLKTSLGEVDMDVSIAPTKNNRTYLNGLVNTTNFNLGRLLGSQSLKEISMNAAVDGELGAKYISMKTTTDIKRVYFNNYDYKNLQVKGELENKFFQGFVGSADPNLAFNLNGKFDLNKTIPEYDFDLNIFNANLHALHINRRDSISMLRGNIVANASGTTLDDINGSALISNLIYVNPLDTVRTGDIKLLANNNSKRKLLALYSDFADIEFYGKLSYNNMFDYLSNTLLNYLPSLSEHDRKIGENSKPKTVSKINGNVADSYYMFQLNVKKANNVAGIFVPGLEMAEGTKLMFTFNPDIDEFTLNLNSSYIQRQNLYATDIIVNSHNDADSISIYVNAKDFGIGTIEMPDLRILGGVKNNEIRVAGSFNNLETQTSAFVNTVSKLGRNPKTNIPQISTRIQNSNIKINKNTWNFRARDIVVDSVAIAIDRFRMYSENQEFAVSGKLSRIETDTLGVTMKNFNIAPFSQLLSKYGYKIEGVLNGNANVVSKNRERIFYSQIEIDSLKINNKPFQSSNFETKWDRDNQMVRVTLINDQGHKLINGSYRPQDKRYMITADFPKLDLSLAEPFLKGVLSNLKGDADAKLVLKGVGDKPELDGEIRIPKASAKVDFTNVTYDVSGMVKVENNNFVMHSGSVSDGRGGKATIDMAFTNRYFNDLKYDIKVVPNKLLALNTTIKDNPLFYGTAYASGGVTIRGERGRITMDVAATTENNSSFFLPLSDKVVSAQKSDFVVFESENAPAVDDNPVLTRKRIINERKERKKTESRMDMNINLSLNVLPNTEVQLVIDPTVGDIVKARGNGTLTMHINPNNNIFTMFGDYQIKEGSYQLTLIDLIKRTFAIQPGSSIQWTGDPIDALLNITAVYKLKTSLAPLAPGTNGESFSKRVPVDCEIKLTDRLSQPTITFDVTVPTGDAETQNIVQNALYTQEMKATQAVWLLALGSFYSDNIGNSGANFGAAGTAATGLEFLTSQLSNMISTDKYNIGIKYRPKDETASSELEVGLSTELVSDKLILEVEGNYGFGDNQSVATSQVSNFSGDFYLTWILDKSGNLKARIFTRTVDRFDENQGLQESGIGIYYSDDFNTFRELMGRAKKRVKKLLRSDKNPKTETTQPTDSLKRVSKP